MPITNADIQCGSVCVEHMPASIRRDDAGVVWCQRMHTHTTHTYTYVHTRESWPGLTLSEAFRADGPIS